MELTRIFLYINSNNLDKKCRQWSTEYGRVWFFLRKILVFISSRSVSDISWCREGFMDILKKNLKFVIITLCLGLCVMCIFIMGGLIRYISGKAALEYSKKNILLQAENFADHMSCDISTAERIVSLISRGASGLAKVENNEGREILISELLRSVLGNTEKYYSAWIIYPPVEGGSGSVVQAGAEDGKKTVEHPMQNGLSFYAYFLPSGGIQFLRVKDNFSFEPFFNTSFRSGRTAIISPYKDRFSKKRIISLTAPVKVEGKVIGVAGLDMGFERFQQLVGHIDIAGANVSLIDGDIVIAQSDNIRFSDRTISGEIMLGHGLKLLDERKQFSFNEYNSLSGTNNFRILTKIDFGGNIRHWVLSVSVPEDKLSDSISGFMQSVWTAALISLLIAIILSAILARYVIHAIDSRDLWYQQVLDTVHSPIIISDMKMRVRYMNRAATDMIDPDKKFGAEAFLGRACAEVFRTSICGTENCPWAIGSIGLDGVSKCEPTFEYGDRVYESEVNFLHDIEGKAGGRFEIFTDITSQHEMIEIIEACPSAIVVIASGNRIIRSVNQQAMRLLGVNHKQEIVGHVFDDFCRFSFDANNPSNFEQDVSATFGELIVFNSETCYVMRSSTELVLGGDRCVVESLVDVTEQKEISDNYARREKHYDMAMNVANALSWEYYPLADNFVFSNHLMSVTGFAPQEKCCRKDVIDMIHPEDQERLNKRFDEINREVQAGGLASEKNTFEYKVICADGKVIWMRTAAAGNINDDGIVCINGFSFDITESKKLESQLAEHNKQLEELNYALQQQQKKLVQQEKLASVGQLAAGVAHEINNPVGFVTSNLNTLEEYMDVFRNIYDVMEYSVSQPASKDNYGKLLEKFMVIGQEEDIKFVLEDCYNLIHESKDGMERVINIVKNLKSFARTDKGEMSVCDICDILDNTLNIVHNQLKYKCEVVKDYEQVPPVLAATGEIAQVFMNILVNASHAIEKNGTITIKVWWDKSGSVCVSIADTGCGISEENLNKIFDPFFTTKEVGVGTGLGLSISHGIIEKHGGTLSVKSKVGEGTTFTISLPSRSDNERKTDNTAG